MHIHSALPPHISMALDPLKGSTELLMGTSELLMGTSPSEENFSALFTSAHPSQTEVWNFTKPVKPQLIRSDTVTSYDLAANTTYAKMQKVRKFFSEVYGLKEPNGPLGLVATLENPFAANAIFSNSKTRVIHIGELGDDKEDFLYPFHTSLDLIAHEITHGVVSQFARLPYQGQSGSLCESLCDIYAIQVKHYQTRSQANGQDTNWHFADNLFKTEHYGPALRSLSNPGSAHTNHPIFHTDPQPKLMTNYIQTDADFGGAHVNASIPSHAFYLAANAIGGGSWETTGKIWDLAMHRAKNESFSSFALKTLKTAGTVGEGAVNSVGQAWTRVGVDLRGVPYSTNSSPSATRAPETLRAFAPLEERRIAHVNKGWDWSKIAWRASVATVVVAAGTVALWNHNQES